MHVFMHENNNKCLYKFQSRIVVIHDYIAVKVPLNLDNNLSQINDAYKMTFVVYAYQWKAFEGKTKESPWRSGIIVFRITVW